MIPQPRREGTISTTIRELRENDRRRRVIRNPRAAVRETPRGVSIAPVARRTRGSAGGTAYYA